MKKNHLLKVLSQRLSLLLILLCLVLLTDKGFSQCPNSDFSMGNFTYWVGSFGDNDYGTYNGITPGFLVGTPNSPPSDPGQQTIMNIPGTDPNTGGLLSVIPPGGSSSCRLGNDLCYGCISTGSAARIEYSLAVTASNAIFTYQYAVILQDASGDHAPTECPKFTIYVLDSVGNVVDPVCGIFEVTAASGLPGFQTTPATANVCSNDADVVWKDWTAVGIDLSSYIGHTIKIQFTSFDCALGGHFGYAYISCSCGSLQITQQCSANADTLYAPAGFASYSWSPGGETTQSIVVDNPVNGTLYTCQCTSLTGCTVTIQSSIYCNTTQLTQQCQGNSVAISAPQGYSSYLWNTGETTNSITIINPVYGDSVSCICDGTIVLDTIITVQVVTGLTVNSTTICSGDAAVINASGNYTYSWNNGLTGQSILVSPSTTTVYTVTATSTDGCTDSASGTVTVNPFFTPSICMVSVDTASDHNVIIWEKPVTLAINEYYIFRETSVSGVYNLIGTQSYNDFSTFIDVTSNAQQQPYRYTLAINDTCGFTSQQSSYHQTIHLTINSGTGGAWNLAWNNYEGFSFTTYNIYRGTSPGNMTLLNSVASNVNSYSDLTPPPGIVYYMLEVVRPTLCNPTLKSTESYNSSISNIAYDGVVSIAETFMAEPVQIYPNPGSGIFTISLSSQMNQSASIEILNSLGQIVYNDIMNTSTKEFDLSELSKGTYSLKLTTDGKSYFEKIVIE
jgi:hypothetical protein